MSSWLCCCGAGTAHDIEKFNSSGVSQWKLLVQTGSFPNCYSYPPDSNGDLYEGNGAQVDSTGVVNYDTASRLQGVQWTIGTDPTNDKYYGEVAGAGSPNPGIRQINSSDGSINWTTAVSANWVSTSVAVQAIDGGGAYFGSRFASITGSQTSMGYINSSGGTPTEWTHQDSGGNYVSAWPRGGYGHFQGGPVYPGDAGDNDWLYKFNSSGTLQWSYPGTSTIYGPTNDSLHQATGGNYYFMSYVSTSTNYYVYKVNSSGSGSQVFNNSFLDEIATPTSGDDYPLTLWVDGSENYYFGGSRYGGTSGSLRKYNSSGTLQWTITAGWPNVVVDSSGNVFGWGADKDGSIASYSSFTDDSADLSNVALSGVTVENTSDGRIGAIYHHAASLTAIYLYSNKHSRNDAFDGGYPFSTTDQICKFESTNATFTGTATLSEVNSSGVTGSIDIDTNTGSGMTDEEFAITGS